MDVYEMIRSALSSVSGVEYVLVDFDGDRAKDENLKICVKVSEDCDARVVRLTVLQMLASVLEVVPAVEVGYAEISSCGHNAKVHAVSSFSTEATYWRAEIAEVWAGILENDATEDDEDFFLAGGSSIRALRLIARIRELADIQLDIRDLYMAPTFGSFVKLVCERLDHCS
jgi:aryl carrier-like protein